MNLKEYLELCKKAYYGGNPIISDSQYDALEDLCSEDLTIGTHKGRYKHWYKMYSLQKYYTDETLPEEHKYMEITPKLDGASLALYYLNGWLHKVVTRGNGEYGEDITHYFEIQIKWIK